MHVVLMKHIFFPELFEMFLGGLNKPIMASYKYTLNRNNLRGLSIDNCPVALYILGVKCRPLWTCDAATHIHTHIHTHIYILLNSHSIDMIAYYVCLIWIYSTMGFSSASRVYCDVFLISLSGNYVLSGNWTN